MTGRLAYVSDEVGSSGGLLQNVDTWSGTPDMRLPSERLEAAPHPGMKRMSFRAR